MKQPIIDFYGQYLDKFKEEYTTPQVDLLFENHNTDFQRIEDKQIEFLEFFKVQFEFFISNYATDAVKLRLDRQGPTHPTLRLYKASFVFLNIFFKVDKVYKLGEVIDKNSYLKPYGYKFSARFITYFDYINLNNELVSHLDEKGAAPDRSFDFQEAFLVLKATESIWNPSESTN